MNFGSTGKASRLLVETQTTIQQLNHSQLEILMDRIEKFVNERSSKTADQAIWSGVTSGVGGALGIAGGFVPSMETLTKAVTTMTPLVSKIADQTIESEKIRVEGQERELSSVRTQAKQEAIRTIHQQLAEVQRNFRENMEHLARALGKAVGSS